MSAMLPPSLAISPADAVEEQVQVHIMPFQLDYTGPAPVSTFLLLSPAEAASEECPQELLHDKNVDASKEGEKSPMPQYITAFRGRKMHATPLPLPPGWSGAVYEVPPPPPADAVVAQTPAPSRSKPTPPVDALAKNASKGPKKFSLDSESDDSDRESEHAAAAEAPAVGDVTAGELLLSHKFVDEDNDMGKDEDEDDPEMQAPVRAAQTLRPLAGLAPLPNDSRSALLVWAPDGPADTGDDRFFRTLGEWQSVVIDTVRSSCLPGRALAADLHDQIHSH